MRPMYAYAQARWTAGVTIRGYAHRCGEHGPGTARCEHTIGHDGPIKPRWRHVGRDDAGDWQVWEADRG